MRLRDRIINIEQQSEANTKLESPDLAAVEADLSGDGDEAEEPAPVVSDYPTGRVKSAVLDAIDGFDSLNS